MPRIVTEGGPDGDPATTADTPDLNLRGTNETSSISLQFADRQDRPHSMSEFYRNAQGTEVKTHDFQGSYKRELADGNYAIVRANGNVELFYTLIYTNATDNIVIADGTGDAIITTGLAPGGNKIIPLQEGRDVTLWDVHIEQTAFENIPGTADNKHRVKLRRGRNLSIPTSGEISFSDFYGTELVVPTGGFIKADAIKYGTTLDFQGALKDRVDLRDEMLKISEYADNENIITELRIYIKNLRAYSTDAAHPALAIYGFPTNMTLKLMFECVHAIGKGGNGGNAVADHASDLRDGQHGGHGCFIQHKGHLYLYTKQPTGKSTYNGRCLFMGGGGGGAAGWSKGDVDGIIQVVGGGGGGGAGGSAGSGGSGFMQTAGGDIAVEGVRAPAGWGSKDMLSRNGYIGGGHQISFSSATKSGIGSDHDAAFDGIGNPTQGGAGGGVALGLYKLESSSESTASPPDDMRDYSGHPDSVWHITNRFPSGKNLYLRAKDGYTQEGWDSTANAARVLRNPKGPFNQNAATTKHPGCDKIMYTTGKSIGSSNEEKYLVDIQCIIDGGPWVHTYDGKSNLRACVLSGQSGGTWCNPYSGFIGRGVEEDELWYRKIDNYTGFDNQALWDSNHTQHTLNRNGWKPGGAGGQTATVATTFYFAGDFYQEYPVQSFRTVADGKHSGTGFASRDFVAKNNDKGTGLKGNQRTNIDVNTTDFGGGGGGGGFGGDGGDAYGKYGSTSHTATGGTAGKGLIVKYGESATNTEYENYLGATLNQYDTFDTVIGKANNEYKPLFTDVIELGGDRNDGRPSGIPYSYP